MCGRFVRFTDDDGLTRIVSVRDVIDDPLEPSWNIAPTQAVRAVTARVEEQDLLRELRTFRWGLVPSWAKDPSAGARMINARVETFLEKPSFRSAAIKRRCVIPMNGYYEWQVQKVPAPQRQSRTKVTAKQPYYLHDPRQELVTAAGLYEFWRNPALPEDDPASWFQTVTIITTAATDALGQIHDRTPLVIPLDMVGDWLDPHLTAKTDISGLVAAIPEPTLTPVAVGAAVGNVRNNGAALIEPVLIEPVLSTPEDPAALW
ncbi:MAG: SOS response-associated peptidase [Cellulomonadaceae bacterium]|jgi:putative SOS response-associated peptidase YedK|nr:SOS response-associated peptidase [Cellulomonadaceae bacterium]